MKNAVGQRWEVRDLDLVSGRVAVTNKAPPAIFSWCLPVKKCISEFDIAVVWQLHGSCQVAYGCFDLLEILGSHEGKTV